MRCLPFLIALAACAGNSIQAPADDARSSLSAGPSGSRRAAATSAEGLQALHVASHPARWSGDYAAAVEDLLTRQVSAI